MNHQSNKQMKALTLWQPWATLVAIGAKRIETRSWSTNYRGPLAIHAARSTVGHKVCSREPFRSTLEAYGYQVPANAPHMSVIAICELVDILPTEDVRGIVESRELAFGDYETGRHAWLLDRVRRLGIPIRAKGAQGLWTWDYSDEAILIDSLVDHPNKPQRVVAQMELWGSPFR
jgi:hypothetical protein